MASQSQPPAKGIYFVITSPTKVTPETWNKWYDEVHIPDVFKSSGPNACIRYDNITSSTPLADKSALAKSEYLAIYPLHDLSWVEGDTYKKIPLKSSVLKGDKEGEEERFFFEVAEIEARTYVWVDGFEGEGAKSHPGPGKVIITAAMTPTKENEAEFDQWYKEEHYGMLAKMKGYLRTRRYRIEKTNGNTGKQAPRFLAVHEFEEGELDMQRLGESVGTDLSKKVMGALEESQIQVWGMRRKWGDLKLKY